MDVFQFHCMDSAPPGGRAPRTPRDFQFHCMDSFHISYHAHHPGWSTFNSIVWIPISCASHVSVWTLSAFQFHCMDSILHTILYPRGRVVLSIPLYGFANELWYVNKFRRIKAFNSIVWIQGGGLPGGSSATPHPLSIPLYGF